MAVRIPEVASQCGSSGLRGHQIGVSRGLGAPPVGFFQVKRQPLEPPVARDAEATRLAILAGVRYTIDHATLREAVLLRMLLESNGIQNPPHLPTVGGSDGGRTALEDRLRELLEALARASR